MAPRSRKAKSASKEGVSTSNSIDDSAVTLEEKFRGLASAAVARQLVDEIAEGLCFLPEVFVFDLDDTLWRGDVDLTSGPPFVLQGSDCRLVAKEGDGITPFPEVADIFEWLEAGGHRAAIASSTGKGPWAEKALDLLRTSRGTSYAAIAAVKEMHRAESVANRSKAVHLKRIADKCGCEPHNMVFFDNMEHNIVDGESIDVTSIFTPEGLTWSKFAVSLVEFDRRALARAAGTS